MSKDYAFNLRQGNSFLMETILAEADLKSQKTNGSKYSENKETLEKAKSDINPLIESIQRTGIILPQTKIPKASNLKVNNNTVYDVTSYNSKGQKIKNRVIKLQPNINLKDIGFKENISSEDLNVIVKGLSAEEQSATLQNLAMLKIPIAWDEKGEPKGFRQMAKPDFDAASENIQIILSAVGNAFMNIANDPRNSWIINSSDTCSHPQGCQVQRVGENGKRS